MGVWVEMLVFPGKTMHIQQLLCGLSGRLVRGLWALRDGQVFVSKKVNKINAIKVFICDQINLNKLLTIIYYSGRILIGCLFLLFINSKEKPSKEQYIGVGVPQ